MSTPQHETKVEQVTDAIEGLVVAVAAGMRNDDDSRNVEFFNNVAAARSDLKEAMGVLLRPVLRVVQ
jgi:hypothetical protein